MSKDIVVIVDGTQETWQDIQVLRTNSAATGTTDWFPEDETNTAPITITENGTYTAESGNLYGFSKLIVALPPYVRGTIDGVEYIVTVDENGYLVRTKAE